MAGGRDMKKRICLVAALFIAGCTHTPDPPEEIYICEATHSDSANRFSATKYLNLDGQLRNSYSEASELRWYLNREDGSVSASFLSQPWKPDAYNHDGKVSLRINWTDKPPVGTRIFLYVPGKGFAFEGFAVGEKSGASGIYTDWPAFKTAIQDVDAAEIVFTNPAGDIIERNPTSLEKFHSAEAKLQELKAQVDQMSENYETACRKETLEYIFLT